MNGVRRFPWWVYWLLLAVIVILANLPLIATLIAASIAGANDCTMTEGVVAPCMIGGQDWGPDLQGYGNSFWFVLVSWPAGLVLFVIWLIVLLVHRAGFAKRVATP